MQEIIELPYTPRPFQRVIHASIKRFNVLVCHRRFGKTYLVHPEIIDRGYSCEHHIPQYAYIAPTYGQAKRIAWENLKYFVAKLPNVTINESELRVDILRTNPKTGEQDKIRIMLLGAENPDSLRGLYLDGVVLDEYAQCPPGLYGEIIRPAISDRMGWVIFIGTPKGVNHFKKTYDDFSKLAKNHPDKYYTAVFRASETKVVHEDELLDARRTMTEDEYAQEYECDWAAASVGSYYAKYIREIEEDGRVIDFDYDRTVGVRMAWDLGINDSTVIWFYQIVGREIRILEYLENNGVGLEWYVKEVQSKPYIYDQWGCALPHDAAARELGSGKTRQEQMEEFGLRGHVVPKQAIMDGIEAVRMLLKNPHIYFHKTKTEQGLTTLRNYRRQYDRSKGIFLDKPLHDHSSNGADGFRILALDLEIPGRNMIDRNLVGKEAIRDYDEFSF